MFGAGIWRTLDNVKDANLRKLAQALPSTVLASRQPNTVRIYSFGFQRWKRWAAAYKEVKVIPAEPRYISLYLVNLSEKATSNASINTAISSIAWAHKLAALSDPTQDPLVQMVRDSLSRSLGKGGQNAKQPLKVEHLMMLVNIYGKRSASLKDLRVVSMCLLAFAAFLWYDDIAHICRSDLLFKKEHLAIFLVSSKTDVYKEGHWIVVARLNSLNCPVRMLDRYLLASGIPEDSSDYVFRALSASKKSRFGQILRSQNIPISYTLTRQIMLQAFAKIGLSSKDFGTHSLRKGGATAANLNKIPDRLIKKHGRWVSEKSKDLYISEDLQQKLQVSRNLGL